jgi:D-glycero-beta-D-manno-heptose-7-phosphate kinase
MTDLTQTIRSTFPQQTVVIVGDIVADQFLNGTISRVSREAPVFILRHDDTETLPGAAGNAAANVASLGGKPILIGLRGEDASGEKLAAALTARGVDANAIVPSASFATTTKIRVLAGQHYAARQQVIRIDYENPAPVAEEIKTNLRQKLADASDSADAIVISDYGYGSVFPEIFADAINIANKRNIPVIVDSRHRLTEFAHATTATPNREEVEEILGKDFSAEDCVALRERLGLAALLVTNGNEGMTLFESDRQPFSLSPVGALQPVDVTGAGDTVIAAYALGLASGLGFAASARIANHAGGIVVMKKRTATVTSDELAASLGSDSASHATKHAG